MEAMKKDQVLCCDKCGVELKVIKDCDRGCACNIVCCGQTMRQKQSAENKADESRPSCCK